MSSRTQLRASLALALALLAGACGDDDDKKGSSIDSGVPTPDSGVDGSVGQDGGVDGSVRPALTSCTERPGDLPRPPSSAELPCELVPPGLVITR